ncbi:MAG: hypothetical protein SF029_21410 [bacterium]|nr:hypothetical protein [bacterium]
MVDASTQLTYIAVGSSSFLLTLIALTVVLSALRRARLNAGLDIFALDSAVTHPQRPSAFELETVEAPAIVLRKATKDHLTPAPRRMMSDQVTILIAPDESALRQQTKAQRRNVQRLIAHLKPGIETDLQAS